MTDNKKRKREEPSRELEQWMGETEAAENMIPIVGGLYRKNNVVTTLYGKSLVNTDVIEILKLHRFSERYLSKAFTVHDTFPILKAVQALNPAPSRVDLGRLCTLWLESKVAADKLPGWLTSQFAHLPKEPLLEEPQDIVLFGFGRIGRLLARILIEKTGGGNKMRLRAIVIRGADVEKRAALLRRDSVHGQFKGTIKVLADENAIVVNGNYIKFINASKGPDSVDYHEHGIHNAILVDNTGVYRNRKELSQHLQSKGISKVILTAPAGGDVPNIVMGCNHDMIKDTEQVFAAASCTTNAAAPILKVMNAGFGVKEGHVETVHSYTNDQNLLDNFHKKSRRGRAAPLNMVITETGAAEAVAKAVPELTGRITGNSIRVPTPNVSLAIVSLSLEKDATKEEINKFLQAQSLEGPLQHQIGFTSSPDVVSCDFVGARTANVVDSTATIVHNKRRVNLYVWYDNEASYSYQVVRLVQLLSGVVHPRVPK